MKDAAFRIQERILVETRQKLKEVEDKLNHTLDDNERLSIHCEKYFVERDDLERRLASAKSQLQDKEKMVTLLQTRVMNLNQEFDDCYGRPPDASRVDLLDSIYDPDSQLNKTRIALERASLEAKTYKVELDAQRQFLNRLKGLPDDHNR